MRSHPDVGQTLNNLANLYRAQGRYSEAERFLKRALVIREKSLGPNHADVGQTLNNLALVYRDQGKYGEAEGLFKRALAIREKALGANHPDVGQTLTNLANVYRDQGKYGEAEGPLKRALSITENAQGANHPDVAWGLNNMAILYEARGESGSALAYSRRATAAILGHRDAESMGARQMGAPGGLVEQRASYFQRHVANLAVAARKGIESAALLAREALEVAQWASQSSAAAALQQMGTRFASGGGALASLVRERQDLAAAWRDKDKALLDALSNPESQQERVSPDARLRKEIAEIERRLNAIAARLDKEFPDYAAVANPQPLTAEEVQKLLGADEALVFFLVGPNEGYVFALTREGFEWRTIPLGEKNMAAKVATFRRGLDVDELTKSFDAGNPHLFDLATAHEFYVALLGPVEALIKDKPQLLIVPSGPLTALPFHLLVTDKPAIAVPQQINDMAAYRDAAWLVKRHAVTVLPSVASLKALRVFARKGHGTKPMVGFGDPVFGRGQIAAQAGHAPVKIAARTRAYSDYWHGASVDRARLADALSPLPDSAEELKAVAAELGASSSDIHLGRSATEANAKHLPLVDYRVVYFATHGLVAGDVEGLGEPSLALTLPNEPSELDDGLLTASEVALLKLNADWVVLSACNTAAGEKPGAEALSGLARAFFYAGARALLVSHWRINSKAATRLTTSTFDIMNSTRPSAVRRRCAVPCSPISTTGPIFGMAIRASGAHSHSSGRVRHVKACLSRAPMHQKHRISAAARARHAAAASFSDANGPTRAL